MVVMLLLLGDFEKDSFAFERMSSFHNSFINTTFRKSKLAWPCGHNSFINTTFRKQVSLALRP